MARLPLQLHVHGEETGLRLGDQEWDRDCFKPETKHTPHPWGGCGAPGLVRLVLQGA